jgi:para-nitrobenzyl esterase
MMDVRRIVSAVIATIAVAMASATTCMARSPLVRVTQGALAGVASAGVDAFLGIPYGATTAGEGRWRSPRPAAAWQGTRRAKAFGPACQQDVGGSFGPYTPEYLVQGEVSENCLSVNVWRPSAAVAPHAGRPHAGLPIMVWVHGGGFAGGAGSVPIYNGAALARGGIIVVTVNYRLGVFGFLAHPGLSPDEGSPGNYGIEDLLFALHWVRDNARAFGGDPSRVTLAGQSAGSMAIHDLMVVPAAKGLFQQVISQSGPGIGIAPRTLAQADITGDRVLAAAGVRTLDELRRLPASRVAQAAHRASDAAMAFAPVIDGRLIPSDPYASTAGTFIDTPILAGMTADEASDAPVADRPVRRERGLAATDRWARARAAASRQPIYLYLFDHVEPGSEAFGAFHSSEIPYALGNLDAAKGRAFTARDRAIARQMAGYWLGFVKTGRPGIAGQVAWPRYDAGVPTIMHLGDRMQGEPLLDASKRRFYDAYVEGGGRLSLF